MPPVRAIAKPNLSDNVEFLRNIDDSARARAENLEICAAAGLLAKPIPAKSEPQTCQILNNNASMRFTLTQAGPESSELTRCLRNAYQEGKLIFVATLYQHCECKCRGTHAQKKDALSLALCALERVPALMKTEDAKNKRCIAEDLCLPPPIAKKFNSRNSFYSKEIRPGSSATPSPSQCLDLAS